MLAGGGLLSRQHRCGYCRCVRGLDITVRNRQMLRLGFAMAMFVSFLALHVVECAVAAGHPASDDRAVAEQAVDHGHGSEEPGGHGECDHGDGHEHDGAAAEVCVALPRTADQVAAEPVDPAINHWSMAGTLLLLRVRRRPGPPCRAASPRGRDLLLSVCIARR